MGETSGRVDLTIVRVGNVDVESTVRCFTISRSAQAGSDYVDRPNTDVSIVIFRRGERVAYPRQTESSNLSIYPVFSFFSQRQTCTVHLIDDQVYEADEQFYVLLGSAHNARLGPHDKASITITNREDVPKIYFEQTNYDVAEPTQPGSMSTVMITVIRSGDCSRQSEVRVTTRDENALAGRDYHAKSQVLTFRPGNPLILQKNCSISCSICISTLLLAEVVRTAQAPDAVLYSV